MAENFMLIIADAGIPKQAKMNLSKFGELLEFSTEGITYPYLSGHPDIFLHQIKNIIICAPNTPKNILDRLSVSGIQLNIGDGTIDASFPNCSRYNALSTDKYFIHNTKFADPVILHSLGGMELISVNQSLTRCSLIGIGNDSFLTSDRGIENILLKNEISCFYIDPSEILLPGMKHGLFGGCAGYHDNKLFLLGSVKEIINNSEFLSFLKNSDTELIELWGGKLFDGGGIFFLEEAD